MSDAPSASEVLGSVEEAATDEAATESAAIEETATDEAAAEAASEAAGDASEKKGLFARFTRTDRPLDLDSTPDIWNPERGGVNRISAATKQMGGWEYLPPALWFPIGTAEALKIWVEKTGIFGASEVDDDAESEERGRQR